MWFSVNMDTGNHIIFSDAYFYEYLPENVIFSIFGTLNTIQYCYIC